MKIFTTFYFERYSFDDKTLEAKFCYSFDKDEFFEETISFKSDDFKVRDDLDLEIIDNLLFHLHIALGISYYKLYPTKDLVIETGFLNDEQISFWKKFYTNGLGEFFIKNDMDPNGLLGFISPHPNPLPLGEGVEGINNNPYVATSLPLGEIEGGLIEGGRKSLLMWGGGKDSIVSSILLEEKGENFTPYVFGKIDRIKENTLQVLGKKAMLVKRKLSENLFKLNEAGYYNGHVPITGIIAFVSLVSAYLYNYKDIVLSNEKSADEENTIWKGLKINHQYSKGGEFERDFRDYVKKNISSDINYYSLLRDKYELEIAEIFAKKASKYFSSFSSCNRNFKITGATQNTNWCCSCEKCAFVYLILSPFLEDKKLIEIFGENLLDKVSLLETYKGLMGLSKYKPFECVGTYKESLESAYNTLKNYKNKIISGEIINLPYILKELESDIVKNYEK
ncbi:MAG: hypothetical protein PHH06_02185 [Candidatus Gracilibacteria bacterium]|nr:hypothetical protein [Candidatus Gracilibacteria bacterium]